MTAVLATSVLLFWLTLFAWRIRSERETFIYPSLGGYGAGVYVWRARVLLSLAILELGVGWFLLVS